MEAEIRLGKRTGFQSDRNVMARQLRFRRTSNRKKEATNEINPITGKAYGREIVHRTRVLYEMEEDLIEERFPLNFQFAKPEAKIARYDLPEEMQMQLSLLYMDVESGKEHPMDVIVTIDKLRKLCGFMGKAGLSLEVLNDVYSFDMALRGVDSLKIPKEKGLYEMYAGRTYPGFSNNIIPLFPENLGFWDKKSYPKEIKPKREDDPFKYYEYIQKEKGCH